MRTQLYSRLAMFTVVALAFLAGAFDVAGMTLAYSVLTNSEVNAVWKKAQGKLVPGFNFMSAEFGWMKGFDDLDIEASLREMTFPVDLLEDRGITSLPEGGREASPMSQNAVDATVQFVHLNGRFTVAKRAKWALAKDPKAALSNQLKFQGKKKIEALGRVASTMFYGFGTNYLAQVDDSGGSLTAGASHTVPLKNGLGSTSITDAAWIAYNVKVGDSVALIASGALVTNGIGSVTAVTPGTPSIGVTWAGSCDPDDGDYLVFANGASATTIDHTSYNRGFTGLLDICTSTSVHSISGSTYPNWTAAYSDTASGRFNGMKWRKACDEMQDDGHSDAMPTTIMSKGVRRDVTAQYQAGVRFSDALDLEIDGDPKARGKKFKGTRLVPPGMVFMFDQKRALRQKSIHDADMSAPGWGAGKELIDDSGWIFAVEDARLMATTNRKLFSYFTNQTEL